MNRPARPAAVRRATAIGAAIAGLAMATACELPPVDPGSVLVGCEAADVRTTITVSSHLDPNCTYVAGFDVTASDVTLDCRNAKIVGVTGGAGILISTSVATPMANVTVRNCDVSGFVNSIKVTRNGFRDLAEGVEFENPTSNILIESNKPHDSRGVGIYVDGYVTGVTLRGNQVVNAGSSGIYLETGSKGSVVDGNVLYHNGYRENGPAGQLRSVGGFDIWFWGVGREGISIDGSFENTVTNNVFTENSAGGIFLYKNCGEYPGSGRYFERRTPADHNVIEGNTFIGGRDGIWIGSRMGENTWPMECTDDAYVDQPGRRLVPDYAKHNTIRSNRFTDVTYGIRVEDDHNQIIGNTFEGSGPDRHAVIVGTPDRTTVLGQPVDGTVLTGNVSTIVGNAHPYRWVHGRVNTVESGNTALGAPAALCEGQAVPRQTLIFVIAAALPGPGGTAPATTPDLTVPTIGVLPDCTA